ncbi:unnamed protein product [Calypogeia fissa]
MLLGLLFVSGAGGSALNSGLPSLFTEDINQLGPIAVQKWLEDLERLLNKASALVLQCNTSATNFNVFFRNKMARKILSITKEIEHVVITQAPLAALQIMEETVQAVYANNRLLVDMMAKLQISLNATAVGAHYHLTWQFPIMVVQDIFFKQSAVTQPMPPMHRFCWQGAGRIGQIRFMD